MNIFKQIITTLAGKSSETAHISTVQLNVPSQYLERSVKVDVFLPPQYQKDKKQFYPTILFNDGQDMPALGMLDTLTQLYKENALPQCIVFALHCNENRINEYGIAQQADYKNRGNKARQYNDFIMHEFLPIIKKEFRCKSEASTMTYAGFSLGGLSALDIAWANPLHFGKVGIFSGSLWWRNRAWTAEDPDGGRIMHDIVSKSAFQKDMKFWFEVGTKDEDCDRNNNGRIDAIDDTLDLIDALAALGYRPHEDIKYVEIDGGEHNPKTWGAVMPDFLKWALA
jgi:predicted alpha/beta superfamily hydrolase